MSTVFRKIFKIYWKILDNSNNAYYYNYNNFKKFLMIFFNNSCIIIINIVLNSIIKVDMRQSKY